MIEDQQEKIRQCDIFGPSQTHFIASNMTGSARGSGGSYMHNYMSKQQKKIGDTFSDKNNGSYVSFLEN